MTEFQKKLCAMTEEMTDFEVALKIGYGVTAPAVNLWRRGKRSPHLLMQWAILKKLEEAPCKERKS